MARIDTSTIECNMQPTEIVSLVKLAEDSARPMLQPGVVLNSVYGASECMVHTDPALLGQVMMNLLNNACKFTTKGAVTFGFEVYDDEIYFFVKDTGAGLDPDIKNKLMDLFENEYSVSQGLGLGLVMSHAIMQKLGGKIGVESRGVGKGSTFWFTVPYSATDEEEYKSEGAPSESGDAAARSNGQPVILVAEDNESNFLLFRSILEPNYVVYRAYDGLNAIEMFKKVNPDLILMDIQMPNMDGYDAVREIRRLSPTVPVIAVTAYAFVTDRQRILESGFNGYVSKPINVNRLEQEIKNCLNK